MNNEQIVAYYKAWGKDYPSFMNMLQKKAYFANLTGESVFANGMKTPKQLNQMLTLADDLSYTLLIID